MQILLIKQQIRTIIDIQKLKIQMDLFFPLQERQNYN